MLSRAAAIALDVELMGHIGFKIDQLMELAGLGVAQCVADSFAPCKVLVIAGPGRCLFSTRTSM